MSLTAPGDSGKLVGLEALRFAAAFGVVVWHYAHFGFGMDFSGPIGSLPFHTALAIFYAYGDAGVQQFWCISGFIFAWRYGARIEANRITFSRFMILRFSRLYPLQCATLLVLALPQLLYFRRHGQYFVYQTNDLKHFLLNLVFAQYWGFQDGRSFNGPSWSISLEVLVYVLFFALSRAMPSNPWSATGTLGGLLLSGYLSHAVFGMIPEVIFAAVFFYAGVIACHLYMMVVHRQGARITLTLLSIAIISVSAMGIYAGIFKLGWTGFRIFPAIVLFPALVLVFQLVVPERYFVADAVLINLGDLTYSSYMVHFPLQLVIVLAMEGVGVSMRSVIYSGWFFLIYFLLVFVIARFVFVGFERPVQNALRISLLHRRAAVT